MQSYTIEDKKLIQAIGKKYQITASMPFDIQTSEAIKIDKNRDKNVLYIELLSKVFYITPTEYSDLIELNNDITYIHGDRAVKNHLWLYLNIFNKYNPHNYSNLKDALIGRNNAIKNAYEQLNKVFPTGWSYRTSEEIAKMNLDVTKYIRKIHPFIISDFVNTNIVHMIKITRNRTLYSKITNYIDKDEVDELIGSYMENLIDKLMSKIKPLNLEKEIAKALRPLIMDALYAYDIEKKPSRWKRESHSTKIAIKLFKGHKVFSQGSPKFLGRQRYDIWIPSLNIAIEYNGRQHYEYVSFFHTKGMSDFVNQQNRDTLKRTISQNNNVVLIEIPYHAEDIKDFLVKRLNELKIDI